MLVKKEQTIKAMVLGYIHQLPRHERAQPLIPVPQVNYHSNLTHVAPGLRGCGT